MGHTSLENDTMANILNMVNSIKSQIQANWGNRVVYVHDMEVLEENLIELEEGNLNKLVLSVSVLTEDFQTGKILVQTQLELSEENIDHTDGYVEDIFKWLQDFTQQQFISMQSKKQKYQTDKTASTIDQISEHGSLTFSVKPFYEYISLKGKDRQESRELILTDLFLPTNVKSLRERLNLPNKHTVNDVKIGEVSYYFTTSLEDQRLYVIGYTTVKIIIADEEQEEYTRLMYLPYTIGTTGQEDTVYKTTVWENTLKNCLNM